LETQLEAASQSKGSSQADEQLKLMHKENLLLQQRLSKLSIPKQGGWAIHLFKCDFDLIFTDSSKVEQLQNEILALKSKLAKSEVCRFPFCGC
jgi:hypothetical protein